jgi:hypothetical protein
LKSERDDEVIKKTKTKTKTKIPVVTMSSVEHAALASE